MTPHVRLHPTLALLLAALTGCKLDPPPDDGIALPPNPDAGCDDQAAKPERLFEEVWTILDETYPYFDYKEIDWQAQHDACLDEVCESEHGYEDFVEGGMSCLLSPLRDWGVGIIDRDGELTRYAMDYADSNIDTSLADGYLDAGTLATIDTTVAGRLRDGRFGYLRLEGFLTSFVDGDVDELMAGIGPVEGYVLDLRNSTLGNSEIYAMDVAGHFVTDTTTPYGFDQYREEVDGDPTTHELGEPIPKTIEPGRVAAAPFAGPVAVLTGEACWTSCDWFIAMMKLAPDVRSFGAATTGATSSPEFTTLEADGETELMSSTSYATLGDGTVIEWNGITPDEPVEFTVDLTDDVLEAAIAWLEGA